MVLTNEEEKLIKEQLLKQLEKVPAESREEIKKQINSMSKEQLEEFIKKNQKQSKEAEQECIFCSIIENKTPSIKLKENEDAIAVLDINPIAIGHTLIVPKEHSGEPNEKTQELAFSVGKEILENLKPKDITTRAAKVMGHTILNVIPIYENTNLDKRIKTSEEELVKTAEKIIGKKLLSERVEEIEVKKEGKQKTPICIMCAISNKEMPSLPIDQNKENIAVLEVNPIARGHTLVIPKIHSETTKLPSSSFTLAKKIAKKIKIKFKANDVKINPTSMNNHALIELIPIYDNAELNKSGKITINELEEMQKELLVKTREKRTYKVQKRKIKGKEKAITLPKRKFPDLPQLPPRIP